MTSRIMRGRRPASVWLHLVYYSCGRSRRRSLLFRWSDDGYLEVQAAPLADLLQPLFSISSIVSYLKQHGADAFVLVDEAAEMIGKAHLKIDDFAPGLLIAFENIVDEAAARLRVAP